MDSIAVTTVGALGCDKFDTEPSISVPSWEGRLRGVVDPEVSSFKLVDGDIAETKTTMQDTVLEDIRAMAVVAVPNVTSLDGPRT